MPYVEQQGVQVTSLAFQDYDVALNVRHLQEESFLFIDVKVTVDALYFISILENSPGVLVVLRWAF